MTPGALVYKDPQAEEPYGFDWTAYLADLGPTVLIDTSEWIISGTEGSPVPLAVDDESVVTGRLKTQAYFSGGTEGKKYRITNRIVTDSVPAVTDDRSLYMLVMPR